MFRQVEHCGEATIVLAAVWLGRRRRACEETCTESVRGEGQTTSKNRRAGNQLGDGRPPPAPTIKAKQTASQHERLRRVRTLGMGE